MKAHYSTCVRVVLQRKKEARLLLMFAFVNEVIDTIRLEALKDRLHLLVEKRFRGELNRCQGCAICK